MEIKAILKEPYTNEEKLNFIVEQNHNNGYEIRVTEKALEAWGKTQEEIEEEEKQRIGMLKLTRGDVFRGLLQAKGVTREQLRQTIINNEQLTEVQRELALIDFDEALNFYRGNPLIDTVGSTLGITPEQLTAFFETNNYTKLIEE